MHLCNFGRCKSPQKNGINKSKNPRGFEVTIRNRQNSSKSHEKILSASRATLLPTLVQVSNILI